MSVFTLDSLNSSFSIFTIGDNKRGSRTIRIGDGIGILISFCFRFFNLGYGNAVFSSAPIFAISAILAVFSVLSVFDSIGRSRTIGIGDGIGIDIAIAICLLYTDNTSSICSIFAIGATCSGITFWPSLSFALTSR